MPIVVIKTIVRVQAPEARELLARVQSEGAKQFKCELSNVWVRLEHVDEDFYLQDRDRSFDSPIVIIMAQRGRSREMKTAFSSAIATEIARGLNVDAGKVWIHYQEMDPADVWHNGKWSG